MLDVFTVSSLVSSSLLNAWVHMLVEAFYSLYNVFSKHLYRRVYVSMFGPNDIGCGWYLLLKMSVA